MCCEELKALLDEAGKDNCFSNATSAKEHGKRFVFDNRTNKTVCRVRVDDCLIDSKITKKCDYLFKVCEDDKYYLVEFKGGAVDVAVEQIIATYEKLNARIRSSPDLYSGIIVSSAVPAGAEQKFRRLQEKCYRKTKLSITRSSRHHTESI